MFLAYILTCVALVVIDEMRYLEKNEESEDDSWHSDNN